MITESDLKRLLTPPIRFLAPIYLCLAVLGVSLNAWITPMGMVPDEPNHFLRSLQISEGQQYAIKSSETNSGGVFSQDVVNDLLTFESLNFHEEKHVTPAMEMASHRYGWGGAKNFYDISNTAVNPPWVYPGVVLGIWLGKAVHLSLLHTFILARLITGLLSVGMTTFAIALCRRGRLFLTFLASMPMTLHLFGSCSQDAILIASAFLGASLMTRLQKVEKPRWGLIFAIALCFVAFSGKPPTLVFLALPLALVSPIYFWRWLYASVIPVGVFFTWVLTGVRWGKPIYNPFPGVSEAGQMSYVIHHPVAFICTLLNTIRVECVDYLREFVGLLGCLDTHLPHWFYLVSYISLPLLLLVYAPRWRGFRGVSLRVSASLVLCLASTVLVMTTLYVIWTPVRAPIILGVQGRYFIPVVAFLITAMCRDDSLTSFAGIPYKYIQALTIVYAVTSVVSLEYALHVRYWT